jgi:hypothetical protein
MSDLTENWRTLEAREDVFAKRLMRVSSYANHDRWLDQFKLANKENPARRQLLSRMASASAGAAFDGVGNVAVHEAVFLQRVSKSFVLPRRDPAPRRRSLVL